MAVTYTNIIAYRAKSTPDFPIADCGFPIAHFRLRNPSRSQIRNPKSEIFMTAFVFVTTMSSYLWRGNQMSDTPKSTYEIVMERLRRKDQEAGVEERQLNGEQKAAIAEARKVYEARAAERRILHESAIARTSDPAEREKLEEQCRRDMDRFARDRDAKIRKTRAGT